MNKQKVISITLAICLGFISAATAQVMYRWVDDQGVVHYGPRAPEGVEATLISTASPKGGLGMAAEETRPGSKEASAAQEKPDISYAEQRRQDREEARKEAAKKNAERSSMCAEMERQRSMLEPSPRVIIEDEEGNAIRMADEDRLARLDKAKQYLSENCR